MTNELYHHGILGQKWGIRRYQNPDGSLTEAGRARYAQTHGYEHGDNKAALKRSGYKNGDYYVIEKGSKTYSNVGHIMEDKRDRHKYVYDDTDDKDRAIYEGPFSRYLSPGGSTYKRTYKLMDDLYVAPVSTQKKIFSSMMKDKKFSDEVNGMVDDLIKSGEFVDNYKFLERTIGPKRYSEVTQDLFRKYGSYGVPTEAYMKAFTPSEQKAVKFMCFNRAMEAFDSYSSTKRFLEKLKTDGFNAAEDANNKKVYNEANNPLIVLDGKISLKPSAKVSKIKYADIEKNIELVQRLLNIEEYELQF